jgi:hypothetical protein
MNSLILNMRNMRIEVEEIGDEDRRLYRAQITRGKQTGAAMASNENKAIQLAKQALVKRESLPSVPVNWENTPESFLAAVNIRELDSFERI